MPVDPVRVDSDHSQERLGVRLSGVLNSETAVLDWFGGEVTEEGRTEGRVAKEERYLDT
jgi:hypothetical protein